MLDLDETIVCSKIEIFIDPEHPQRVFSLLLLKFLHFIINKQKVPKLVLQPRPFLAEFLKETSKHYSVLVYTSSLMDVNIDGFVLDLKN